MGICTKTPICGKYKDVPSTPDGLCKVSCISDNAEGDEIHEFIGPVKIIMVDTSMKVYARKVAAGAVLVFVNMLIGASVITLLYFSLCYDSLTNRAAHVAFCTLSVSIILFRPGQWCHAVCDKKNKKICDPNPKVPLVKEIK